MTELPTGGIQTMERAGVKDAPGLSMAKSAGRWNTRVKMLARRARSRTVKDGEVKDDPDDL